MQTARTTIKKMPTDTSYALLASRRCVGVCVCVCFGDIIPWLMFVAF